MKAKLNKLLLITLVILTLVAVVIVAIQLTKHYRLTLLASWKLNNLVETRYFEHTNKGGGFSVLGQGVLVNATFQTRSYALSLGTWHAGEILYHGECDYNTALRLWNESPTHAVILNDQSWSDTVSLTAKVNIDECYIVNEYAK